RELRTDTRSPVTAQQDTCIVPCSRWQSDVLGIQPGGRPRIALDAAEPFLYLQRGKGLAEYVLGRIGLFADVDPRPWRHRTRRGSCSTYLRCDCSAFSLRASMRRSMSVRWVDGISGTASMYSS